VPTWPLPCSPASFSSRATPAESPGLLRPSSLGSLAGAGVLAVDAASLLLLELFEWLNIEPAFGWGHVAVTGLWSLVALSLLAVGARRSQLLGVCGLVVLGATIMSFAAFTVPEFDHVSGWSALILAGACASAALLHGLLASRPMPVVPAAAVTLGALLSGFASYQLLSEDLFGYGLLAAGVGSPPRGRRGLAQA
jgi:hypothetical protein